MAEITEIPVAQITPGDNDREAFNELELRELAGSIGQHGLAQPITVRYSPRYREEARFDAAGNCTVCGEAGRCVCQMRYEIVAGERRYRAVAFILKWETIPAIVRTMSDEQAAGVMLLENIQRAELNPIEEARAYHKRMVQFGWDEARVAHEASVSVERVRLRLTLLDIVPEAQQLIRDGHLGVKYAYVMRDLDANRQRLALRYLSEVESPRLSEFRKLCAKLLAEQAQESLFDMVAFMSEVQMVRDEEAANRPERIIPTDDTLPAMRKARSVGQALERFIRDLLDQGDDDAARVVGSVYLGLVQHHLTAIPTGPSPLIPGETLAG